MPLITKALLPISALLLFGNLTFAETVFIVHPSNNSQFTEQDISRLYLGKTRRFPNGTSAVPLERPLGTPTREHFLRQILEKTDSQLRSYWSRLVFTGRGIPPEVIDTDAEVKELVARNPNLIGYVDDTLVDDSVKVVHKF